MCGKHNTPRELYKSSLQCETMVIKLSNKLIVIFQLNCIFVGFSKVVEVDLQVRKGLCSAILVGFLTATLFGNVD